MTRTRLLLALALLIAAAAPATAATLEWDRNAEPEVAGYQVYIGSASRQYNVVIDVGSAVSWRITNLVAGTTYWFAVTAYTGDRLESDFSEEISWRVPYPRPLPPLRIRIGETNPPSVNVPIMAGTELGVWRQIGAISLFGTNVAEFLKSGQ